MRVVISTAGRFHLFALARELHRRGHLERIFSGFPWRPLARERVPRDRVSTLPLARPLLMGLRYWPFAIPHQLPSLLHQLSAVSLDAFVRKRLPDCDIFVGHEGVGLWTGQVAQGRGIPYVCDRGATHARSREQIMQEEFRRHGASYRSLTERTLDRELEEYDRADRIVVPSNFVKTSFVNEGVSPSKIEVVPYGVDLQSFYPSKCLSADTFDVLFAGNLSLRKGATYLIEGFEKAEIAKKTLTVVGAISEEVKDLLSTAADRLPITLTGPLPPHCLRDIMSSSHALVLPSIEEGLALVQAEALACGCPVIATANTGALDLFEDGKEGFIVPVRSSEAIAEKLTLLGQQPDLRSSMSEAAVTKVRSLGGWDDYAERMIRVYQGVIS